MDPGTQPESLISDWPNSFVDTTPIPKRIWEAADPPADTVAQSPFPIFIPVLFSSVPLSPQNKVTRDRSWTVRLWNVTTLQDFHISSVVDINGSNRTFPICRLHMWQSWYYHDVILHLSYWRSECMEARHLFTTSRYQSRHQTVCELYFHRVFPVLTVTILGAEATM